MFVAAYLVFTQERTNEARHSGIIGAIHSLTCRGASQKSSNGRRNDLMGFSGASISVFALTFCVYGPMELSSACPIVSAALYPHYSFNNTTFLVS